jgi:hypothetical protein
MYKKMSEDKAGYFKEGDMVAHKENLEQRLEVRRIIRRKSKLTTEEGERESFKVFTLGIECGWWSDTKTYKKEVFHTKSIIPWDVAQEGFIAVVKYLGG